MSHTFYVQHRTSQVGDEELEHPSTALVPRRRDSHPLMNPNSALKDIWGTCVGAFNTKQYPSSTRTFRICSSLLAIALRRISSVYLRATISAPVSIRRKPCQLKNREDTLQDTLCICGRPIHTQAMSSVFNTHISHLLSFVGDRLAQNLNRLPEGDNLGAGAKIKKAVPPRISRRYTPRYIMHMSETNPYATNIRLQHAHSASALLC